MAIVDERERGTSGDGFVVAPTTVRPRGRPAITAAGIALAVALVAVLGADDRPGMLTGDAVASPRVLDRLATGDPRMHQPVAPVVPNPTRARPQTPSSDVLAIDVRSEAGELVVHGDVFSLRAVVVVISLADEAGNVAESHAVRLEASGTSALAIGANAGFDVRFPAAPGPGGADLWIHANAYDIQGMPLAKIRQVVQPAPEVILGIPHGGSTGAASPDIRWRR